MANLKELRTRIGSVKNTRKITSAMSQIAAARLSRAQNAMNKARAYGVRMDEVVDHLVSGIDENERAGAHPLLAVRPEVKSVAIIALAADRGLCGGFNANVTRAALNLVEEREHKGQAIKLRTVGKKARGFFEHRRREIESSYEGPVLETIVELSKQIAADATTAFKAGEVDEVFLISNRFVSMLTQEVEVKQLVPLVAAESDLREPAFEPSRPAILEHLVPVAVESRIQQAMFNSIAAELAARRTAMDSATENATEMISDLTLEYNRERQAAITKELMEIIGGAEALKG